MKKRYFLLPLALALASIGSAHAQLPCTNPISSFPYNENFDSGPGGWTSSIVTGTTNSWVLGTPAKPVINSAFSGPNSWVTGLTADYPDGEGSCVTSPCFNFSTLGLPIVEMKVWWNSESSWDGAVLQSSIDGGTTWQNVGAFGDPDNWYTDNTIGGNPGGQQEGWTGRVAITNNGSNGWVTAKHVLTGLAGQSNVRLRIAFGADGSVTDDGFAFDNFQIYEPSPIDVGVASVTAPATVASCSTGPFTVTVNVQNYGSAPQSNIPVSYLVNGGTPVTATIPGPLAPGASVSFTFPTPFTAPSNGTYAFSATTSLANDGNNSNNGANGGTVTVVTPISTYPYTENFDNGTGGWAASGAGSSWALGTPAKATINSAASGPNAWVTSLTGSYNSSENSFVTSPCFDFSSLTAPALEMKIWWEAETDGDGAILQSSTNNGQTWVTIGRAGDPDNWYNSQSITAAPGGQFQGWSGNDNNNPRGSGGWVVARHRLQALAGQPNVRLRVLFASNNSATDDGIAFDDFKITNLATNDVGVSAILSPTGGTSCALAPVVRVTVRNFGTASQSNIPVNYTINGGTPVTATLVGPLAGGASATFAFPTPAALTPGSTSTFAAFTSLTGDADATNNGVGGVTLNSINAVSTFPYNENFDNGPGGWASSGTASTWALGTPNKSTINSANSAPNAWVTSLTGSYNNNENSFVTSPCFDFSSLGLPGIEFYIWWDSENSLDGAALQGSIDGGRTWLTIGNVGDPDNWYTDGSINGNPGGQQQGWTGSPGSGGWVLAKHAMPQLARQPNVRLRIAFGSEGFGTDNGFAFDDVKIVALPPPPQPLANDLSVLAFIQPTSSCTLGNAERISVLVLNSGTRAQSNVPVTVKYTTPGGTVRTLTTTLSGPILPGGGNAQPVLFPTPQNLSANGCYEFKAYATLAGDTINANDTAYTRVCKLLVNTYPYSENFDGSADGWSPSGGTWALGTPNKSTIRGAASGSNAWVNGGLSGRYGATESSSVEGPCFNLNGLNNPVVQLKVWYQTENGRDGASLQYSLDNGNSWQTLGTASDPTWYNSATIISNPGGSRQGWTGASNGYVLVRRDLAGTPVFGQSQVRFRVVFGASSAAPPSGNDTDDGVAFDDFAIYEKPNNDLAVVSMQPVGTACGYGIETITARVKNLGTQPASNFTVSYRHNGAAPVTGTVTQVLQPNDELDVTLNPPVDLSAAIAHTLVITVTLPGDQIALNNALTINLNNNVANLAPIIPVDFETSGSSVSRLAIQTLARSNVFTAPGQGNGGTALVMTGAGGGWTDPVLPNSAWTLNADHLATATLCVNPSNMNTNRPFYLFFDLKQIATGTGALFTNTNLRVMINGTQVGATYQPSPTNPGTATWQSYVIPLAPFRNGNQNITIQFQSSANRNFASGSGDASFLDNIRVDVATALDAESVFGRGVSVFPNPSTGVFRVVLDHEGANDYSLLVTDLSGRTIRKQGVAATGRTEASIDLTSLARGVYMLRVTDANGNQSVRKLTLE